MNHTNSENKNQFQEEKYHSITLYAHPIRFEYDVQADRLTYTVYAKADKKTEYRIENYFSNIENSNVWDPSQMVSYLSQILEADDKEVNGEFDFIANLNSEGHHWYRAHFASAIDDAGEVCRVFGCVQDIEEEREEKKKHQLEMEIMEQQTSFYHYEYGKRFVQEFLSTNPKANTCGMMVIQVEEFEKMASLDGSMVENAVFLNIVETIRRNNPSTAYFIRSGSMQFMVFDTEMDSKKAEQAAEQIVSEIMAMYIHEEGDLALKAFIGLSMNEIGDNFFKMYHNCQTAIRYAKEHHFSFAAFNAENGNPKIELSYNQQYEQTGNVCLADENRIKYSLPSNISYEIRTPLNAILGMTTLARTAVEDKEKVTQYLEKISASTSQLITAFNKVSDMSEMESGKICLTLEPSSMEQDIEDLDKIYLELIKQQEMDELNELWFAGKRILLVEDNRLNIEVEKGILEKKGFLVEVAKNGKLAVDMVEASEENYYDLILMDIRMPVMDGNEATQKIRNLSRKDTKFIPIFAVTANAFYEDMEQALEAGMDAYITKPVNIEELFGLLLQHLK